MSQAVAIQVDYVLELDSYAPDYGYMKPLPIVPKIVDVLSFCASGIKFSTKI